MATGFAPAFPLACSKTIAYNIRYFALLSCFFQVFRQKYAFFMRAFSTGKKRFFMGEKSMKNVLFQQKALLFSGCCTGMMQRIRFAFSFAESRGTLFMQRRLISPLHPKIAPLYCLLLYFAAFILRALHTRPKRLHAALQSVISRALRFATGLRRRKIHPRTQRIAGALQKRGYFKENKPLTVLCKPAYYMAVYSILFPSFRLRADGPRAYRQGFAAKLAAPGHPGQSLQGGFAPSQPMRRVPPRALRRRVCARNLQDMQTYPLAAARLLCPCAAYAGSQDRPPPLMPAAPVRSRNHFARAWAGSRGFPPSAGQVHKSFANRASRRRQSA